MFIILITVLRYLGGNLLRDENLRGMAATLMSEPRDKEDGLSQDRYYTGGTKVWVKTTQNKMLPPKKLRFGL